MICTMPDKPVEISLNVFDLYGTDSACFLDLFVVCFYLLSNPFIDHLDFVWEVDVVVFAPCFYAESDFVGEHLHPQQRINVQK